MPSFGKTSKKRLATVDPRLQKILNEVIKIYDFTILCGHRTEAEQNEAYSSKKSQLKWPNSKHNTMPSIAVDIAPWPIDWNNIQQFKDLAKIIIEEAKKIDVELIWGGTWETLKDYPHFELKMIMCSKCKIEQPTNCFGKNNNKNSGYRGWCKTCENKQSKAYVQNNPDKRKDIMKDSRLNKNYGITLEQYNKILKDQENKCAICGESDPNHQNGFCVDHDHKTGKIRGILCNACNRGLGYFKDDTSVLSNAIKYLHSNISSNNKKEYLPSGPSDDDINVTLDDIENEVLKR